MWSNRRCRRILPIVFITFSLAFLDRANFGLAAAGGMARDLQVGPSTSALIGAMFFLGYFLFQIPGAAFAQKRSLKWLIFVCLLIWGMAAVLTGLVRDIGALLLVRFVLGAMEAAVIPSMLLYLSRWFSRAERSRANTLLMLGNPVTVLWMSVLSGYLIQAFDWRWMFILEGAPAILWAIIWVAVVDERPAEARWLTQAEKTSLAATMAAEQRNLTSYRNYFAVFKTPTVAVLALQYFCWSIGSFGFILWLPSILKKGSALGIVETGWLTAVPYVLAIAAMLSASYWSDRLQNRRIFVWPFLLTGAFALFGSYTFEAHNFWLSFALLAIAGACMYAPMGIFYAIVPEKFPENVVGGAIALINSMGALGSFVGAYFVGYLNDTTGSPGASFLFMAVSVAIAAILMYRDGKVESAATALPVAVQRSGE